MGLNMIPTADSFSTNPWDFWISNARITIELLQGFGDRKGEI